jgi:hypothetical protein
MFLIAAASAPTLLPKLDFKLTSHTNTDTTNLSLKKSIKKKKEHKVKKRESPVTTHLIVTFLPMTIFHLLFLFR